NENKNSQILLTDSEEVRKATDNYYKDQFKVRKHYFDHIKEE
ncbi:3718_t:CDS:1, partial [Scutellospora calospora]